jgi:hypothetical protein
LTLVVNNILTQHFVGIRQVGNGQQRRYELKIKDLETCDGEVLTLAKLADGCEPPYGKQGNRGRECQGSKTRNYDTVKACIKRSAKKSGRTARWETKSPQDPRDSFRNGSTQNNFTSVQPNFDLSAKENKPYWRELCAERKANTAEEYSGWYSETLTETGELMQLLPIAGQGPRKH